MPPTSDTPRRPWLTGLAITLLGLLFRLPWALQPRSVRWDEADYLILASNLLAGRGYQIFGLPDLVWPPGAPLLAYGAMAAGAPAEDALAFWHVLAGALIGGLLYGLGRAVTGREVVAVAAGLLAAASPALAVWPLYWGSLTESTSLALLLAGLWACWRLLAGEGGWRAGLAGGAAFGASYLIRTEGIFWWGLFLLILTVAAIARRRGWQPLLLFALSGLLFVGVYAAYLYKQTGRLLISGKTGLVVLLSPQIIERGGLGQDFAAQLDSSGQEILWLSPETLEIGLLDAVRADPRATLRQMRANLTLAYQALTGPIVGLPLLGLAILGLFARTWDRRRWAGEAFWLASLLPLGLLFITKVETRYLIPAVPIALIWAGWGVVHLAEWLHSTAERLLGWRRFSTAAWAAPLLAGLLLAGLLGQWQVARTEQPKLTFSHKEAGCWLAENSAAGEAIMTRNTEVGLYAGRPLVAFPAASWPEVLAYGQARNFRYLVVDDWELENLRPQLSFLLEPSLAPPALEHLQTFEGPRRKTILYRVR